MTYQSRVLRSPHTSWPSKPPNDARLFGGDTSSLAVFLRLRPVLQDPEHTHIPFEEGK